MNIGICAISDVLRRQSLCISQPVCQGMTVEVHEAPEVVIKVNSGTQRVGRLHARRMPRFKRLSYQSTHEPIAYRFCHERIALSGSSRGYRPVREGSKFLVARDFHPELSLDVQ